MNATATGMPIRALLFDGPDDAEQALVRALRSADAADDIRGGLGRMADTAKGAVVDRVGSLAGEILEMDVGAIFDRVWGRYRALVQAAEETVRDPDLVRMSEMMARPFSVTHRPRVEVLLHGRRIATAAVELTLTVTMRGLVVEVRHGCLVGVRAGDAVVDGALSIAGRPVTSREHTIDLVRALPFPSPIRLAG